ncbi:MAG TPA: GNAT family N-acetyltransferase [Kofleriaceae bacterium]|nr:GNAT family N-acetyltransferase [Kofleriaceae bacterium]
MERLWRSLEAHAQSSYFLSWAFIENWLAALPEDERPALAVIFDGGQPTGAFFLAQRRLRRNLVMTSNALYFNATGAPKLDELAIEHNGMLAMPGSSRSLASVLALLPGDWDELYLPALDRYAFDDLGGASSPLAEHYKVRIEREETAPFVDLDAVRAVEGGYDALLPASTRTHIQRSRALLGNIDLEVAVDERQALDIYGELLRLHARRWAARGLRGAFADPWFERFHRQLILNRLLYGDIQLMRIKAGSTTLGCLYNFVHRGRVVFYQSGLATLEDTHIKPGYICHATAIEYNALAGHAFYDLLGGQAKYKENLATGLNRRVWLRVQRPLARFSLEDGVKRWYELLVGDRDLALRPV